MLALVVSGLGHAYLRRWARAFGWYVAITATLVFVVPDAAVDQVVAGDRPPIAEIAPALVAVAASVVDAYVLAVRNNRKHERRSAAANSTKAASRLPDRERSRGVGSASETAASDADLGSAEPGADSGVDPSSCPHCGRETDTELAFCQWCAEPLDE